MNDTPHRLLIQSGPNAGHEYELIAPSITIGRYPLAEIVIDDPDIAYRHALLTHGDASYRIADLGSDSGTYVNGQRIGAESVVLAHGDIILLGSRFSAAYLEHAIEVEADEQPAAATILDSGPGTSDENNDDPAPHELEDNKTVSGSENASAVTESEAEPYETASTPTVAATTIEPSALSETVREVHHPGPLPAMPSPQKNKNGRIILIAAGCLVALLACCCSSTLFMYFIGGDWLLRLFGYLP